MGRSRWVSRLAAAAAGLTLVGSGLTASPAPVAAAATDSDAIVFVAADGTIAIYRNGTTLVRDDVDDRADRAFGGDFTSSSGTSVFLYNPGPHSEVIFDVSGGEDGTGIGDGFSPESVGGTYTPLVGDFDGNGLDDILWYGPGSVSDSLWLYSGIDSRRVVPLTITGTYQPVVLDVDADTRDDIVWYAPGSAADSIWTFGPNAVPSRHTVAINGRYDLIPGRFGDSTPGNPPERLLFNSSSGPDPIWTFDTEAGHISQTLSLPTGEPVVADVLGNGRDAILWYTPGAHAESFTFFSSAGVASLSSAPQVNGTYEPHVGDLDGNGRQDIAWTTPRDGDATVWTFDDSPAGHGERRITTDLTDTTVVMAYPSAPEID